MQAAAFFAAAALATVGCGGSDSGTAAGDAAPADAVSGDGALEDAAADVADSATLDDVSEPTDVPAGTDTTDVSAPELDAEADTTSDSALDIVQDVAPDAVQDVAPDAVEPDTAEPDTSADTGAGGGDADSGEGADAGEEDAAAACTVFGDPVFLVCKNGVQKITKIWDASKPECPVLWEYLGQEYTSVSEVQALLSCNDCVLTAFQAVSFITCQGPKLGYDVYQSQQDPRCGLVYDTPEGPFFDLCDWSKYACYCE
jgi:hypothetical protein